MSIYDIQSSEQSVFGRESSITYVSIKSTDVTLTEKKMNNSFEYLIPPSPIDTILGKSYFKVKCHYQGTGLANTAITPVESPIEASISKIEVFINGNEIAEVIDNYGPSSKIIKSIMGSKEKMQSGDDGIIFDDDDFRYEGSDTTKGIIKDGLGAGADMYITGQKVRDFWKSKQAVRRRKMFFNLNSDEFQSIASAKPSVYLNYKPILGLFNEGGMKVMRNTQVKIRVTLADTKNSTVTKSGDWTIGAGGAAPTGADDTHRVPYVEDNLPDDFRLVIDEMPLYLCQITPNPELIAKLTMSVANGEPFNYDYRSMVCVSNSFPATATSNFTVGNIYRGKRPRTIIFGFQSNRQADSIGSSSLYFDNLNIGNYVNLKVNQTRIPYEIEPLNFADMNYADMITHIRELSGNNLDINPVITYENYGTCYPLLVFNTSNTYSDENVATDDTVDISLEINRLITTDTTKFYCLMIFDKKMIIKGSIAKVY